MFENILGQPLVSQLKKDISDKSLAPSLLFYGPAYSGKGSTALELARVLSCEKEAGLQGAWGCDCVSCEKHRNLTHADFLVLGKKEFSTEIKATAAAFTKDSANKTAFIRAIQKLMLRFNPIIWQDDPKASRIAGLTEDVEESLDSLMAGSKAWTEKQTEKLISATGKLEAEGVNKDLSVRQARNAAAWCVSSPFGRHKTLIIENAGAMGDEARNSLLKLLEEPPSTATIVLCASSLGSLLQTIRSRLRPYRFVQRDKAIEADIIRRVFKDQGAAARGDTLTGFLDSFLSVSNETISDFAKQFYKSTLINTIKFDEPGMFKRFLAAILDEVYKDSGSDPIIMEKYRKLISDTAIAVETYNQNPVSALEGLGYELSNHE
ncbi:MAG: hypothetical protein LBM77_12670 [Spirochaetaceae bacterium]|nr:hypothetical protein [Spirochaetaceae bacterium]